MAASACGGVEEELADDEQAATSTTQTTYGTSSSSTPYIQPWTGPVLEAFWFVDRSSIPYVTRTDSNAPWVFANLWDITSAPTWVHFTWLMPSDIPDADVSSIATGSGYSFEAKLNGAVLARGTSGTGDYYLGAASAAAGCPSGRTCLSMSVRGPRMFEAAWPWDVTVTFAKHVRLGGTVVRRSTVARIEGTPRSYFAEKIAPIFQHDRCSSCHRLGSASEIIARHGGLPLPAIIEQPSPLGGTRLTCGSGCHGFIGQPDAVVFDETFEETEWMAPKFDQGIDWTGKTPKQICETVTAKLPSAEARRFHFYEDARIAWAVHSGELPLGRPALPTAPPNNYYSFVALMEKWIAAGGPCPQ